ncbi:MAG: molecular chaperone [Myxococcota bacterium]
MTPENMALARSRTYGFVGEVLLDGWTARAVDVAASLPIGRSLPPDADRRAVEHQRVFGRSAPPYESVFCSLDGLMGGATAAAVRTTYSEIGFAGLRPDVEPDHAGLQCLALSFLCAAEADARRDGVSRPDLAEHQQQLLKRHLARWAHLLHLAVQSQGSESCTELCALLVDLVEDHSGLHPEAHDEPDLLANPQVGIRQICSYLLTPARCGVWWGAADLQRLADQADLACGFGRRQQMMESLWFSAIDHQVVPRLVDVLVGDVQRWCREGDPRPERTSTILHHMGKATIPA